MQILMLNSILSKIVFSPIETCAIRAKSDILLAKKSTRHWGQRVIATPFTSTLTRQVWLETRRVWLDRNRAFFKALLDGRVRLGESQVRLTESKCWWKELRLHVGGSVSLTLSQEGCPSVALLAHVLIGEKIKCYLALIFAHGDTIYLYSYYCW